MYILSIWQIASLGPGRLCKWPRLCHNINMENKNLVRTEEIIEPEILDENGNPIGGEHMPKDSARQKGDSGGIFGGILVLAFGFIMTLLVAAFSIFVLVPLMLIGRVLGFQVRTFKR